MSVDKRRGISQSKQAYDKLRKPVPPPNMVQKDKSKYNRNTKRNTNRTREYANEV